MKNFIIILIIGCSFVFFGCKPNAVISFNDIGGSSLIFSNMVVYSDGGSLGYFFKKDDTELLGVILPVRLKEGGMDRVNVLDGTQSVQLVKHEIFSNEDTYTLKHNSELENALVISIQDSLEQEEIPMYKKALEKLLAALLSRNFLWKTYYEEMDAENAQGAINQIERKGQALGVGVVQCS